jgi:nucleoside-diphosphate-sugar epimerase
MSDKRILVTGGDGFIGRNLQDYVRDNYNNLYYFTGRRAKYYLDINDRQSIKTVYHMFDPTHIIHLAAMTSPNKDDPTKILDVNLKGTMNLLESLEKPVDFIFASSILVYGNNENCFYENDRCQPCSVYATSKLACENLLNIYFRKGKIRPRVLRLCGNVGKYLSHGRIYEALSGTKEFKMFGQTPWSYVPYCYIGDTIKAIEAAIYYNKPSLTVNITPTDTTSLQSIFALLEEKMNTKFNITSAGNEVPEHICCHNVKADYELKWKPTYSSIDAVRAGINEILI